MPKTIMYCQTVMSGAKLFPNLYCSLPLTLNRNGFIHPNYKMHEESDKQIFF